MTAEDGERGDNSDARWKTSKRAAETGNALLPTVDRRVRRTSRDVDEAECTRRLVPPIRHSSRQQGLLSCWSPCLQHPARQDDISTITDDFLSTSENLAFQTILSRSHHL